jgi:HD-like signal output (HDOD) protein
MQRLNLDQELDRACSEGPVRTLVIPPCPELLTRLQAVMQSRDPDWDEVLDIASADVAMAAALVRTANSPIYARNAVTHSVDQAMGLLGLKQTAMLLMQFLTMRALPSHHPALAHFWIDSSRRALAMGHIARQLYDTPPDLAHTFGLFCDVGMPVLLQGLRGYGGTLLEARARKDRSIVATEQAAHQTDHAIVGALVARTWRLPPALKEGIRLHHEPGILDDEQVEPTIRRLIAASVIAEQLVHRFDGIDGDPDWLQRGGSCKAHLHISEDELVHWGDALSDTFAFVKAA